MHVPEPPEGKLTQLQQEESVADVAVRVDAARVGRVHNPWRAPHDVALGCIDVTIELGYSIRVDRTVRIDGINAGGRRADAEKIHHFLIVLLGGKDVLIQTPRSQFDRPLRDSALLARVFLNRRVFGALDGMVFAPYGMRDAMLDAGLFYQEVARRNFDMQYVRHVLNGGGNNG